LPYHRSRDNLNHSELSLPWLLTMRWPRFRYRLDRTLRSTICVVLLLGQAAATFGYPVVSSVRSAASSPHRPCGCPIDVPASCCCDKSKVVVPVEPELSPCCAKHAKKPRAAEPRAESNTVRWVSTFAAQRCHGETPSGLLAAEPAIVVFANSSIPIAAPLADLLYNHSDSPTPVPVAPPIPPPRPVC
jgi:hypothetical protein